MKVILYFTKAEKASVLRTLKTLKMENDNNIILIDACNDKTSASNVK